MPFPRGAGGGDIGNPRKTLFLTHVADYGGAEISLLEILERIDREKVTPVFATLSDGPLAEDVRGLGIDVHVVESADSVVSAPRKDFNPMNAAGRLMQTLPVILRLADLIEKENIEVGYTNSTKAHILGGFAGNRAGAPVIWHFRDYLTSATLQMFFTGFASTLASCIVCNSSFTSTQFSKHGQVFVARNGIPPEKVKAEKSAAEIRKELVILEDAKVAGVAGRLDRWKGQHVFIEAAGKVAKDFPEARFLVVGGPIYGSEDYENELKSLASRAGIADKTIFTGFRKDVFDVMNTFDAYVHPSIDPEPFGRGLIEAMLLEKPVVATSAGGPLEIVLENETGLFCEPGDSDKMAQAIKKIFSDPDKAAEMGRNGKERAEKNFNSDRLVERITKIILEQKVLVKTGS